jgi:hypothetical protein
MRHEEKTKDMQKHPKTQRRENKAINGKHWTPSGTNAYPLPG